MTPDNQLVYVYDGSFDGFLSCVFVAFERKENPGLITVPERVQCAFGQTCREIPTNEEQSGRVFAGLEKAIGTEGLELLYYTTLSTHLEAGAAALQYIRLGFRIGKQIHNALTDEYVMQVHKAHKEVSRSAEKHIQFLRFKELEGGILFAEFAPEPHVLPVIMPRFADRLGCQPFLIHDRGRQLAGLYDTKECRLVSSEAMTLPAFSEHEEKYRALWKDFYNAVAIKERINYRRRQNLMPKKYWYLLCEI